MVYCGIRGMIIKPFVPVAQTAVVPNIVAWPIKLLRAWKRRALDDLTVHCGHFELMFGLCRSVG